MADQNDEHNGQSIASVSKDSLWSLNHIFIRSTKVVRLTVMPTNVAKIINSNDENILDENIFSTSYCYEANGTAMLQPLVQ